MIRAAVVGYGNIGRAVLEAIAAAPDFELAGVVRRSTQNLPQELAGITVVDDIAKLSPKPEVAILCTPTRAVPQYAKHCLELGICTADSYDIHTGIWDLKQELEPVAKAHGAVSVISAGWDPGSDSIVRTLMQAAAPKGVTYTDFGPGMSMGHTVAVKAIAGVCGALSMTIPLGTSIHRRMVYVQLEDGHTLEEVAAKVKADPYFAHDETHVMAVPDVNALIDMGHGVHMERKGVSGATQNQRFTFTMAIDNPALTGQMLVAAARAAKRQAPGAYTMIELPMLDLLCGDREQLIRTLV